MSSRPSLTKSISAAVVLFVLVYAGLSLAGLACSQRGDAAQTLAQTVED